MARESSLTDIEAAALAASASDHPALLYHHGRQRVDRELSSNGGDVDALFADN